MSRFRTPFEEKHARYYSPNGEKEVVVYTHHINKHGNKEFVENGTENIYEKIQAQAEESKIETLINRVIAGDVSALRPDGQYLDCTQMPKTLAEAQSMIADLQDTWGKLPIDLRAKYNHSVEEFVAAAGQKEWLEYMGFMDIPVVNVDNSAPITNVEKGLPNEGGET